MPCLLRFAHCLQKMALIIQNMQESYFQREYIKTQKFEKKYSKYLSQAFQIRNNTDYADFFVVSFEDAREQADRAREFLTAIEEFLKAEDIGENK